MTLQSKKILVTGGAGFIGSHLVDLLLSKGSFVRVLDNLANGSEANISHHFQDKNFEFIKGSITDTRDVQMALKDIDLVFNLACLGVRHSIRYPFENHQVNAEGTLLLLQQSLRNKIQKFIHCSSSEVYGTAQYVPMDENHPAFPNTVYGASKLAGESYARAFYQTYHLPVVVLRPFNTFGPRSHFEGDAGEIIPKTIVRALNSKPLVVFGDGKQTRDFTFVKDTAAAMVMSALNDELTGGTFNIGSCFEISIADLVGKIKALTNSQSPVVYEKDRPGDVLRLFALAEKFNLITGWKPEFSFEDGLCQTIDWFKNSPGLSDMIKADKIFNWE
jgi:UDP-glucose 4-epimerase